MVGEAARGKPELRRTRPVAGARVVCPQRLAAQRIQRRHRREGRAHEQAPTHHQRRHLEAVRHSPLAPALADVAIVVERLPHPRHAQRIDVLGADLVRRRILGRTWIAAVRRPIAVVGGVVEGPRFFLRRLLRRRFKRREGFPLRRGFRNGRGRFRLRRRDPRLPPRQPAHVDGLHAQPLALGHQPSTPFVVALPALRRQMAERAVLGAELERRHEVFRIAHRHAAKERRQAADHMPQAPLNTHIDPPAPGLAKSPCRARWPDHATSRWRSPRSRSACRARGCRPASAIRPGSAPESRCR